MKVLPIPPHERAIIYALASVMIELGNSNFLCPTIIRVFRQTGAMRKYIVPEGFTFDNLSENELEFTIYYIAMNLFKLFPELLAIRPKESINSPDNLWWNRYDVKIRLAALDTMIKLAKEAKE